VIDVVYDGKLRVQAIIGILGASIALVVAVLFDDIVGLARRRRKRRTTLGTASEQLEANAGLDNDEKPVDAEMAGEDREPQRSGAPEKRSGAVEERAESRASSTTSGAWAPAAAPASSLAGDRTSALPWTNHAVDPTQTRGVRPPVQEWRPALLRVPPLVHRLWVYWIPLLL